MSTYVLAVVMAGKATVSLQRSSVVRRFRLGVDSEIDYLARMLRLAILSVSSLATLTIGSAACDTPGSRSPTAIGLPAADAAAVDVNGTTDAASTADATAKADSTPTGGCSGDGQCAGSAKACEKATCDLSTGTCVTQPLNSGNCDDGDPCTSGDTCSQGQCAGVPVASGCNYEDKPDLAACDPGETSDERKAEALARVNEIRALSGLAPVTYDASGDAMAQESSLMMVANSDLDHTPPSSWECYTDVGADGAAASNLHIAWRNGPFEPNSAASTIDSWVIDDNVTSLGHRRWILDPFLKSISYGSVHGPVQVDSNWPWAQAASLVVIGNGQADIEGSAPEIVAYPIGDYPAELFDKDWYFSFGVIADDSSRWKNGDVQLAGANVEVVGPEGAMTVTNVDASNDSYGLPNHLQWRVQGLQTGVEYQVTVSGVSGDGTKPSYSYSFKLQ